MLSFATLLYEGTGLPPFLLAPSTLPLNVFARTIWQTVTKATTTSRGTSATTKPTPARLCLHSVPKCGSWIITAWRQRQDQLSTVSTSLEAETAKWKIVAIRARVKETVGARRLVVVVRTTLLRS
jgi:hypothetical protein